MKEIIASLVVVLVALFAPVAVLIVIFAGMCGAAIGIAAWWLMGRPNLDE